MVINRQKVAEEIKNGYLFKSLYSHETINKALKDLSLNYLLDFLMNEKIFCHFRSK